MDKLNSVDLFFDALAERKHRENDLSDVVYALCAAEPSFKQFFLNFFFMGRIDVGKAVITREYSLFEGRPDFWIESGKDRFIIEVKIWDGNHHFEQYYEALDGDAVRNKEKRGREDVWRRLGYIANYASVKDIRVTRYGIGQTSKVNKLGCSVKTWRELAEQLEKHDCLRSDFVRSFLRYLKAVCPFDSFSLDGWNFVPNDFNVIRQFYEECGEVIKKNGLDLYTRSTRNFASQYRMGRFFYYADGEKDVYGWLGAYYYQKGAVVCIEFEDRDGWGKSVCDLYRQQVKDGSLCVYLDKGDWQQQFELIIKKIKANEGISLNDDPMPLWPSLLSMKSFPFMLNTLLFAEERRIGRTQYVLKQSYGSDQEVPDSHCGSYFELVKENSKPGEGNVKPSSVKRGWAGVMYEGDEPKLVIELDYEFAKAINKSDIGAPDECGWYAQNVSLRGAAEGLPPEELVRRIEKTLSNMLGTKERC